MTGTIRLGKGVHREVESEESRRRNRGFDVQEADIRPVQRGSAGQGRRNPIVIRTLWGKSDESTRRRQALPEEVSAPVRVCWTTATVMERDRNREVSRGRSSHDGRRAESVNARSRWKISTSLTQQIIPTAQAGWAELASAGAWSCMVRGIRPPRALASLELVSTLPETAVYDKYVRWCGRTGPRGPSYPIPTWLAVGHCGRGAWTRVRVGGPKKRLQEVFLAKSID